MKIIVSVILGFIALFASGCSSVRFDREAGVLHLDGILGQTSSGYTERSGLTIVNPAPSLRMEVTYQVCTQLNRSNEIWQAAYPSDPYPIVMVYEGRAHAVAGEDILIPTSHMTNHNNILRVTLDLYDGDKHIERQTEERWASFYNGTWQAEWRPYPADYLSEQAILARIDPNRLAEM